MTSHNTAYLTDYTDITLLSKCSDNALDPDGVFVVVMKEDPYSVIESTRTDVVAVDAGLGGVLELDKVYRVYNHSATPYAVGVPNVVISEVSVRHHLRKQGTGDTMRRMVESLVFDRLVDVFRCLHVRCAPFDTNEDDEQILFNTQLAYEDFELRVFLYFRYGGAVGCCNNGPHKAFLGESPPVCRALTAFPMCPSIKVATRFFPGHLQLSVCVMVRKDDTQLLFRHIADYVRKRALDFVGMAQGVLPGLGGLTCVIRRFPNFPRLGYRLYPFNVVGYEVRGIAEHNRGKLYSVQAHEHTDVYPGMLSEFSTRLRSFVDISRARLTNWTKALVSGEFEPIYITFWRVLPLSEVVQLPTFGIKRLFGYGDGSTQTSIKRFTLQDYNYDAWFDYTLLRVYGTSFSAVEPGDDISAYVSYTYENCPLFAVRVSVEFREFDDAHCPPV